MAPLFPYQAIMPRPQTDRTADYSHQSTTAPPANEVLDSLLTGYLWGCLLVALFLAVYFAISFCVWAIGAALTGIDALIDCLRPCDGYPGVRTDSAMTGWPLPDKYETAVYLQRVFTPSENGDLTGPWSKSDKDLWDVLTSEERVTLLEEKGVKNCLAYNHRSEHVRTSIPYPSANSEDTMAVEIISNTADVLKPFDQLAVTTQY
ncbi:hypothetical protein G6011_08171 [Alternaria panax]|uniref:Uncharacterized protein n=1 Tax=Alternaria panax TaxID=48097 RepID=A0AAD4FJG9_9PLEO|nr:hypothetical protein G6011_08171 [Alternaria panax]